jgi:phosphosulfolactate phosphohydrolase-like enzyme
VITGVVNAKAIAAYIKLKNYDKVSLVCREMRYKTAAEDELCPGILRVCCLIRKLIYRERLKT